MAKAKLGKQHKRLPTPKKLSELEPGSGFIEYNFQEPDMNHIEAVLGRDEAAVYMLLNAKRESKETIEGGKFLLATDKDGNTRLFFEGTYVHEVDIVWECTQKKK